jgi:hypothetical protein
MNRRDALNKLDHLGFEVVPHSHDLDWLRSRCPLQTHQVYSEPGDPMMFWGVPKDALGYVKVVVEEGHSCSWAFWDIGVKQWRSAERLARRAHEVIGFRQTVVDIIVTPSRIMVEGVRQLMENEDA